MFLKPFTAGLELAGTVAMETYAELAPVQPDRSKRHLEREYANGESEFVEIDDSRIHYRDEGPADGPTLLALHGTYSSLHTWDGWVDELSDTFRIVRLDMPGFGLTGPRTDGAHTLEHLVGSVGEFCDELDLSEIAVVGNSLGGGVAWRLAIDRPDIVSRLVLLNAGGATLLSNLADNITSFGTDFVPRYMTPRMTIRLLLLDAYGDTSKVTNELVARYHNLLMHTGNRRAVIEIARNYKEQHYDDNNHDGFDFHTPRFPSAYDLTAEAWDGYDISQVTVPTLFQWGSEDSWLHVSFGEELANKVHGSQFVTYDGVGHVPMEESPIDTAVDAAAFIRDGENERRERKPVTA
jgi:pimeloyl-ACP methyl ester carboxylesterase